MQTPVNRFKRSLAERRTQLGLWLGLASAYTTEICAGAGFDWLLLDGEHAPNDLQSLLSQLQAIAGYPDSHPVARVPMGHGHVGEMLIKQYLDLGVQTLLVPMVDTAEQAEAIVRAARYPSAGHGGVRGMAGARASRWGRHVDYPHAANDQICLLMQAETPLALCNLEAILAVEGVDGVFIGPTDLSATMGHLGNPAHPQVQAAITDAIRRIVRSGKAAGILALDEAFATHCIQNLGATFVAVGVDTHLLARTTTALAAKVRDKLARPPGGGAG